MSNALKNPCYRFKDMEKEEIFRIWQEFLEIENKKKYSQFEKLDCVCGQSYIDEYEVFCSFVNDVLHGFVGTKDDYCKKYNISDFDFDNAHKNEYVSFTNNNWIGEDVLIEKEIAEIFKISYLNSSLNWCEITRNFKEDADD